MRALYKLLPPAMPETKNSIFSPKYTLEILPIVINWQFIARGTTWLDKFMVIIALTGNNWVSQKVYHWGSPWDPYYLLQQPKLKSSIAFEFWKNNFGTLFPID